MLAGVRVEAGQREARARDVEAVCEIVGDDARRRDDELRRQGADDVVERDVDRDRHDREVWRPEHHHGLHRLTAVFINKAG